MPRKGYKTVCVTDEVYKCLKDTAKGKGQSIPKYIDHLLEEEKEK